MFRSRREGAVFEDLPQRDIDFADSISVLKIQEVNFLYFCNLMMQTFDILNLGLFDLEDLRNPGQRNKQN